MFKKLLSLGIALVMFSGMVFIAPEVSPALEKAHASEAITEVTASDFEAIRVNKATDTGVVTLFDGYKAGSGEQRLTYNGRTNKTTTTNSTQWYYFKYDISALQSLEEVESAVLSFAFNFNKNIKGVYIKELKKETWDSAVSDIAKVKEDSTTVIDASKYLYPYEDTTVETLGTVNRSYGNASGKELEFKLTGIDYTKSTYAGGNYKSTTITGGPLLTKIKDSVEDGYFYFSASLYSENSTDTNRYGTINFTAAYNNIEASSEPKVIYNSVAGNKFNTTVTTLSRETDFTYTVNIASKNTNVRLLAAIHGKYGALSGVVMSDTLSSNSGNLSLAVPLSSYPDATSVRCFIWDANTSKPYAEPKETPVKTLLQEQFDGKKVIFVGNSHIFYGRTVKASYSNKLSNRTNDTGGFYQLCKQNGIDVSVTNWTFSGHGLSSIFGGEPCYTHDNCQGVVHLDELTDNNYDYVVITPGVASNYTSLPDHIETIHNFFKAGNPDVKVIILGNASVHGINADSKSYPDTPAQYKDLYEKGYPIADWGYLVKNIIEGTETVEGATQTYNKKTFIVKDNYHPNMLSGYIATLFTYCTITGEKASGQPYMYFWNANTAPDDVAEYVGKYYNGGDADTTFPEILKSEADIRGIQKLVDKYMEEKAFLTEY